MDIPDSWSGANLEMRDGTIHISVRGRHYYLNEHNKGPLTFELLDGGTKSEEELEQIWAKHASGT